MKNCLKTFALFLGFIILTGCASSTSSSPVVEKTAQQRHLETREAVADANQAITGKKLVKRAHTAIGTPYVLGGTTPGGFDCSGFVKWAYKGVGVQLPRTAREQSVVGKKISSIKDMRAGDIVAFRHPKRGYHTGIYVGDGKFIHSPRKRSTVRIASLNDPYFSSTLLGARRVNMTGGENLVAQAEERLGAVKNEKITTTNKRLYKVFARKKNGKNIHLVASKTGKTGKHIQKKTSKGRTVVAANSKTSKMSKNSSIHTKKNTRTLTKNTSPVKAPAKQIASKKNAHKTISMLQQHKDAKRSVKNNRS